MIFERFDWADIYTSALVLAAAVAVFHYVYIRPPSVKDEIVHVLGSERGPCFTINHGLDKNGAMIMQVNVNDGWALVNDPDGRYRCERITTGNKLIPKGE